MYVGMLLLYAGIALIGAGPWSVGAFSLVFLILNFYVVAREEVYLKRRFGEAYDSYRARVRRWL
jgi:protein-S-isoprenylcysteine O-methyltransferase Ste14